MDGCDFRRRRRQRTDLILRPKRLVGLFDHFLVPIGRVSFTISRNIANAMRIANVQIIRPSGPATQCHCRRHRISWNSTGAVSS